MVSHYAKLLVSEVLLICNLQEYLSFWKAHFALDEKQNSISFNLQFGVRFKRFRLIGNYSLLRDLSQALNEIEKLFKLFLISPSFLAMSLLSE